MDTQAPDDAIGFQGSNVKLGEEGPRRRTFKPHVPRQPQIFFSIHLSTGGLGHRRASACPRSMGKLASL